MAQEIEIEFKNMLTKDEFEQLVNFFKLKNTEPITQTNHYFETSDFQLKKNGAAIRIREIDNLWQLTLKEPHPDGGLLETHDPLTVEEAKSWIAGDIIPKPHVAKQLNQLGIDFATLKYGGSLTTHRRETTYQDTIIVLDYSEFNQQSDYELEIEAKDYQHGLATFNQILTEHQIEKRETNNKIKRFYDSL